MFPKLDIVKSMPRSLIEVEKNKVNIFKDFNS